ncbi:hypothetical protein J6590_088174 [Homalodisca vitripennis]|nr:hypothetical protein J6590_088174 [Homalodisca vitripennis]
MRRPRNGASVASFNFHRRQRYTFLASGIYLFADQNRGISNSTIKAQTRINEKPKVEANTTPMNNGSTGFHHRRLEN